MILRILMIAISFCLLTACTGSAIQAYKQGNINYAQGDYHAAFLNYQIAADGHVPAGEYALGYMYYYGIGISRDQSKVVLLMKHASIDYPPAKDAINMLQERDPPQPWLLKLHL